MATTTTFYSTPVKCGSSSYSYYFLLRMDATVSDPWLDSGQTKCTVTVNYSYWATSSSTPYYGYSNGSIYVGLLDETTQGGSGTEYPGNHWVNNGSSTYWTYGGYTWRIQYVPSGSGYFPMTLSHTYTYSIGSTGFADFSMSANGVGGYGPGSNMSAYGSVTLPALAPSPTITSTNVYGTFNTRNIYYSASATVDQGTISSYSWTFNPTVKYTTLDLLKTQKIIQGQEVATNESYRLYDINEDGSITNRDLNSIQANLYGSSGTDYATATGSSGNIGTYTCRGNTVDICGNCDYTWTLTVTSSFGTTATTSGTVHTGNKGPTFSNISTTPARTSCSIGYNTQYHSTTTRNLISYSGTGTKTYDTSSLESSTISITGLSPWTSYSGTISETDSNGITTTSNVSFSTTGNNINVTSFYWDTITQSKIKATWAVSVDTNDSYKNTYVEVYNGGTLVDSGTTTSKSWTATGLSADTTYTFYITVRSNKGTSATTYKTFTTDKATVICTSTETLEVGESIWKMKINLSGSYANRIECNLYRKVNGTDTLVQTRIYNPSSSLTLTWEGLDPGTEYYCSGTITTPGSVSGTNYTSSFSSIHATTLSSNPVKFVKSDSTIEPHEAYVLGRGNIYDNAKAGVWQYWRLDDVVVGTAFANCYTSVGTGQGYVMLWTYRAGVAVLPGVSYTLENPSSNSGTCTFYVMEFDGSGVSTSTRRTVTKGNSVVFTTSSTTEFLLVCLQADTSLTTSTAKNYNLKIFRTDAVTPILKNNIVYLNGKIRYIDIIQSGNNYDDYGYVNELQVYRKNSSTNIASSKTVLLIRGTVYSGSLSNVTDGSTSTYVKLSHGTSPSIVRVDLGQEYTDIDYIRLYRVPGYVFNETAIYGRDTDLNLTYKFHDYKITGTYEESNSGLYCKIKYAS